jgi:predicted transcriptional regulator
MKVEITALPVASLEVCDRARVRHQRPKDGSDIVLEYAEAYQCGLITEPLDVFREKGTERYIVADGEHRVLALRRAKIKDAQCRLHEGDEIAALDFAIGCNQSHGLRRTDRDKYHGLARIMETSLREKYRTDTELSEKLGVSVSTVKRYKAQWRDSEGGNARVREKKEAARDSAEKKTPKTVKERKAMVSNDTIQAADKTEKTPKPARTEPSKAPTPEPSKPLPKSPPKPAESANAPVSKIIVSDVRRALGMLCDVPPGANLASEFNATDWARIEKAHAFLSELLGKKHV